MREELDGTQGPQRSAIRPKLEVGDLVVGTALLAVAVWFWFQAGAIDDFSGGGIGAADFPRGLATLFGCAALVLIGNAAWRLTKRRSGHTILIERPLHVVAGMGLLIVFPALMTWLGYYPAMAMWLAVFLWLADCRSLVRIVIYVAGFLVFTKVVFELVLKTPLP